MRKLFNIAVDSVRKLAGDYGEKVSDAMSRVGGDDHEKAMQDLVDAKKKLADAASAAGALGNAAGSACPSPISTPN